MIRFDARSRSLTLDHATCRIEGWRLRLEANGSTLSSTQAECSLRSAQPLELGLAFRQLGLSWIVRQATPAPDGTLLLLSTLTNQSDAAIALGRVWLLDSDGPVAIGHTTDDLVCLPLSGEITNRAVFPLGHEACPRTSKIKCQFLNRRESVSVQVGFVTFQRTNTEVDYTYESEAGITRLRASCDFAGWELQPGASTETETFIIAAGNDPYAQLESWADLAAERCGPRRWEDAPIGWIGWSWVDAFNSELYEDVLLRNCEAIKRRLAGFGVDYVWLSLGNLAGVNPGDWLNWNDTFFPHGPEYLGQRLKGMGFRWGLWCGVFWMCSALEEQVDEFRDALLKNEDGSLMVVRPEWQFGDAGKLPRDERPCMYALDPSHPKALAFLRRVFRTYREWGVRYYMLDFLHAGAGNISTHPYAEHHDRGLVAGPEVYQNALRNVREAAGDDTYFLSSSGPTVHNAGVFDAIRTGNDFGEGRPIYPDSYFYPATFVINSSGFWTGPMRALQNQASAYYTHRKLYINDSGNVLTVGKPLPLSDAQIHATIHGFSGGPSMIGDDVDRLDDERLALLKKTLPRSRDVGFPVDLFDAAYPACPKVFHRKIEKPWGRFAVVAVYNLGDAVLEQRVDLARLGLSADGRYLAWEFWNSEYLGCVSGCLTACVPPRSVRVYRLTADLGRPTLLGTDMHLLMGEMEVLDCTWDEETRTARGSALRPAGETGSLYLHAPTTLRVADPTGLWVAKDARDNSLIVRVRLAFGGGPAKWTVRFAALDDPLDMGNLDLT